MQDVKRKTDMKILRIWYWKHRKRRTTDGKLRRLSLEVVLDQVKYEKYQSELVAVHGIKIGYCDEILGIIMPVLIPHRKEQYTDYLYKPLYIAFKQWCIEQNQEQKRYRNMKNVRFVLCICIIGICRLDGSGITIILKKSMSLMWFQISFLCQTAACM